MNSLPSTVSSAVLSSEASDANIDSSDDAAWLH